MAVGGLLNVMLTLAELAAQPEAESVTKTLYVPDVLAKYKESLAPLILPAFSIHWYFKPDDGLELNFKLSPTHLLLLPTKPIEAVGKALNEILTVLEVLPHPEAVSVMITLYAPDVLA